MIINNARFIDPFKPPKRIPQNNIAHLMYYLSCVNCLIDFEIPTKLIDFDEYEKIDFDDENDILRLAVLLSPELFIIKRIMIPVSKLKSGRNEFYPITEEIKERINVICQFDIRGKQVHADKIMFFKETWMIDYYSFPMRNYSERLKAISNGDVEKMRPKRKSRVCSIF